MARFLLLFLGCLVSLHCAKTADVPALPAAGDGNVVRAFMFHHETLPDEFRPDLDRLLEDQAAQLWMNPEGSLPWRPGDAGFAARVVHVRSCDESREPVECSIGVAVVLTRPVPGDVDETHRVTAVREGVVDARIQEETLAAIVEAHRGASAHVEVISGSDEAILEWLAAAKAPHLLPALDQVRERRIPGAAIPLRRLLVQNGPWVREALGAAMALRDPALLSDVARLTGSQSTDVVRAAIHAIAAIGTPRSRQYLESIAETHAWEEARVLARDLVR